MQTTNGPRTFWFECQRSTKFGKHTGNEFEGYPYEKGLHSIYLVKIPSNYIWDPTYVQHRHARTFKFFFFFLAGTNFHWRNKRIKPKGLIRGLAQFLRIFIWVNSICLWLDFNVFHCRETLSIMKILNWIRK